MTGDNRYGARRRRRAKRQNRRTARRAGAVAVVFGILGVLAVVTIGGLAGAAAVVDDLPKLDDLRAKNFGENSTIYAADGSSLCTLARNTNRQPVSWSRISPNLRNATVAIEDRRFWQHGGIDYEGIARAAWKDIATGSLAQGGSTITQQVVRNLYIANRKNTKTFQRKIDEAWLAIQLEKRWTKREILETYLNIVFFGNNAYGAEAASQIYFSKHAKQLTLPEAALLAGLPQLPSTYDPFTNRKAAKARRNAVLRAMRDVGMLGAARYRRAVKAPMTLKPGRRYKDCRQPYVSEYVKSTLIDRFGANQVLRGGLNVRTTIDLRLQFAARRAIQGVLKTPGDPSAAIVSIDPRTGYIRAMQSIGTAATKKFNLAVQGARRPGSTFKTVALTTAVDAGINPATTSYTSRSGATIWGCGSDYAPETFDHRSAGRLSLERATILSDNSVYAQLSADLGVDAQIRMARRLGVVDTPIPPDKTGCAIALGGLHNGVTPLEMTSVYATLAAGGMYSRPQIIRKVTDAFGNEPPNADFSPKRRRVIRDGVAATVTSILEKNSMYGTGRTARTSDGRPQAGKTGTVDDYTDAWFCGYTPDLATCVWMGYPKAQTPMYNVEGVGAVSGPTLPSQIWHAFMDVALAKVPPTRWPAVQEPAIFRSVSLPHSTGVYSPPTYTPPPTTTATTPPPAPATTAPATTTAEIVPPDEATPKEIPVAPPDSGPLPEVP